jgi:hypothetical protein
MPIRSVAHKCHQNYLILITIELVRTCVHLTWLSEYELIHNEGAMYELVTTYSIQLYE